MGGADHRDPVDFVKRKTPLGFPAGQFGFGQVGADVAIYRDPRIWEGHRALRRREALLGVTP
jgi:hypothetical protein